VVSRKADLVFLKWWLKRGKVDGVEPSQSVKRIGGLAPLPEIDFGIAPVDRFCGFPIVLRGAGVEHTGAESVL